MRRRNGCHLRVLRRTPAVQRIGPVEVRRRSGRESPGICLGHDQRHRLSRPPDSTRLPHRESRLTVPAVSRNSPASATPKTAPICRNMLTTPDAVLASAGGTATSGGDGHNASRHGNTDPEQYQRPHIDGEAGVLPDQEQARQAGCHGQRSSDHRGADSDPGRQRLRGHCGHGDRRGQREEPDPGPGRGEALLFAGSRW